MKKTHWQQKKKSPTLIHFNSTHKYISLTNRDSLYRQNLSILKQPEFHRSIRTITKDICFLLVMNTDEFFKQLEDNPSLRISLESCLIMFPRRVYARFEKGKSPNEHNIQPSDQSYKNYKLLVQAVLLVYYRISKAPSEYKQFVYDEWLLDIPKLLDIAAIYGQSNQKIVKQIIANAYKTNSYYDQDTLSFFNIVQNDKLNQMQQQRGSNISFTPEFLSSKNYRNQQEYMVQQTIKLIFTIKDILFNLTNFLKYFPEKYVLELVTDYKIQERLVDGVTHFMQESTEDWKLLKHAFLFQNHLEDLRQSMAVYFIMEFNLLKKVVLAQEKIPKDLQEAAQDTYITFCLLLSNPHKKKHHRYYQKLINNLIEESDEAIFFTWPQNRSKIDEKSRQAIDKAIKYEKYYRKNKKNISTQTNDYEAVFNRYRKSIIKYKQISQNALTPLQQKKQQKYQQQRRKRQIEPDILLQINHLKYKYNKQYDDDPEEQHEFHRVRLQNDHDYYKKIYPKPELNLSFDKQTRGNIYNNQQQFPNMSFSVTNTIGNNHSNGSFTELYKSQLDLNISSISIAVDQTDSLKEDQLFNILDSPAFDNSQIDFAKNANKHQNDNNSLIDLDIRNQYISEEELNEFEQFLEQQSYKCDLFQNSNMSFNMNYDQ